VTSATSEGSRLFEHNFAARYDPSVWTDRRKQLLKWFERAALPLAAPYEGAVRLLYLKGFPGQVHFVCHVVRDIYQLLPEVLEPTVRQRVQPTHVYPGLLDELSKRWPRPLVASSPDESAGSGPAEFMPIAGSACQAVEKVLLEHAKVKGQPSSDETLVQVLFRLHPSHRAAAPARLVEAFKRERKWFTDRAHLRTNPTPTDGLIEHFERFEAALFSFVGDYFTGTRELDAILLEANKRAD
jgi:hypothetical protein